MAKNEIFTAMEIRAAWENVKRGLFPNFGSPETLCSKCMFHKTVCFPDPKHIGCLGGWKRGKE